MFSNYLKIAVRNLLRYKSYSVINLLGLAIGMACSILIFLYINHELSYDSHNEQAERLYRVTNELTISGKLDNTALTPFPLGPALERDFPEIELAGRFMNLGNNISVEFEDRLFMEQNNYFADSSVLDMFTYSFVYGDAGSALRAPNTAILSESMALRLFGDIDPVGQTLMYNRRTQVRVDAVVEDLPNNSHLHWNSLVSMATLDTLVSDQFKNGWLAVSCYTYVLLGENQTGGAVEAKLTQIYETYVREIAERFKSHFRFAMMPVTDIYLDSPPEMLWQPGPTGSKSTVFMFIAVAAFVLLIASINYMNLATARSANRSREIGIRKVVGAMRGQLMRQFLLESLLLTSLSLLIALVLAELLLPWFNTLTGQQFSIDYFSGSGMLLILPALVFAVGILAGSYPALFLSSFRPIQVLKGKMALGSRSAVLRKALVVFQFVISISMIIGTWIVFNQLHYLQNKDLGFKADQVLAINVPPDSAVSNKVNVVRTSLEGQAGITQTAIASSIPGGTVVRQLFKAERDSVLEENVLSLYFVDYDFIEVLGIPLLQGRNFDRELRTDALESFIVNQTMVDKFGWDDPIGKRIQWGFSPDGSVVRDGRVVGVVDDFHVSSLHSPVEPLVLILSPGAAAYLYIGLDGSDVKGTIDFVKETWRSIDTKRPLEYYFMDEYFNRQYANDERQAEIFLYFALLTIFIACLGLFGLASFTSEQRTKEIGIRKVIGASVPNVVGLLSKDFLLLVAVAIIPAWALTYWFMDWWLQDFAYRVRIGPDTFLYAGIIAVSVSLLTISFQAVRAALNNPVDSLKYE